MVLIIRTNVTRARSVSTLVGFHEVEESVLPFLAVRQRVVGRKSSICPGIPPAGERFLVGRPAFVDLRFSRW